MNTFRKYLVSAAAIAAALLADTAAFSSSASAQSSAAAESNAATLGSVLEGLGTTGRVLIIGAHPDDEDTNLIAWLTRGRHVETAYLSLTRGDGGQNLIGNELGEALGIIRTQELLAARRIDGGRQYFTRAYDFGFSKTAEETLQHWPRDTIFGDVMRVVRAFRPHVIIAIFSGTPRDGHGHHQVSGIMAREVYDLSADTVRFPVRRYGAPWTVGKFYRNARFSPDSQTFRMNVGEYSPLLGRSYAEIAAESRSQHKSQGFGVLQRKGVIWDFLQREASRVNEAQPARDERSLFDGIDTTWTRLSRYTDNARAREAIDSVAGAFAEARNRFQPRDPSGAVAPLARAARLLGVARSLGAQAPPPLQNFAELSRVDVSASGRGAPAVASPPADIQRNNELWDALTTSLERTERALIMAAGVSVEAIAPRALLPVREPAKTGVEDSMSVGITVYNRGRVPVSLLDATVPRVGRTFRPNSPNVAAPATPLLPDSQVTVQRTAVAFEPTQSWWRLLGRNGKDWFATPIAAVDEVEHESRSQLQAVARLSIEGVAVDVTAPVVNRFADPVKGDQQVPVAAVPGITVGLENVVEYIRANVPVDREFRVNILSAYDKPATVYVTLQLPAGLTADSLQRTRTLTPESPSAVVTFRLKGKVAPGRLQIGAIARHEGTASTIGYYTIDYEHIAPQRMYGISGMWLSSVDVNVPAGARVGYVPGVGDHGIEALEQLGIPTVKLDPATLGSVDLTRFTAIVVGPRAYEAQEKLAANNRYLLAYANRGGTLVVQYGQNEMMRPGIMPYPIELTRPAARVTLENAPVRVLLPNSPLLTTPNRITPSDWEGWVQERATYMPSKADVKYTPLLAMNDPNEPENRGALLVAPVGRGRYIYVTLAMFRQLPSGVPGAARLLMNLIAPVPQSM